MNFLIVGAGSIEKTLKNLMHIGIEKKDLYVVETREDRQAEC